LRGERRRTSVIFTHLDRVLQDLRNPPFRQEPLRSARALDLMIFALIQIKRLPDSWANVS